MAVIPPDFHGDARKWDAISPYKIQQEDGESYVEAFNREHLTHPKVETTVHTGPRLDTHPLSISERLSPFATRFKEKGGDAVAHEAQRKMMATLAHKVKNDIPFCLNCTHAKYRSETDRDHMRGDTILRMDLRCNAPARHCDRSVTVNVTNTVDNASLQPPPWLNDNVSTGPAWHRRSEPFKAAPKPRPKDQPETEADAW